MDNSDGDIEDGTFSICVAEAPGLAWRTESRFAMPKAVNAVHPLGSQFIHPTPENIVATKHTVARG